MKLQINNPLAPMNTKNVFSLIVVLALCFVRAESQDCNIIPYPQHVEIGDGEFSFNSSTTIIATDELSASAKLFADEVKDMLGMDLKVISKGKMQGNIILISEKKSSQPEAYELKITSQNIEIKSASVSGIFYGLQSLKQLLICSGKEVIKAQVITDLPRFSWRGVMLDVSRTFMPVNLVKRYIDLFSMYKLNVVHLHLTDDQGWRIEIKKYPLLTKVGSKFDPEFNTMGGYYSQDEIRDLIQYAELRNVMLVPEIEMPGHACAAIASYPELSCDSVKPAIHTFFEGKSIHNEILCAGKESTYNMIFGILDEICELFPSQYIHIGGDEAPKAAWEICPYCQKAMKDNNLLNEEELQSFFVKRVGDYIRGKNKTLVGWDEIIDGGKLAGDEVLMFWRGWKLSEVEKEVKAGFRVVCTPTTNCYFDYPYDKISTRTIFDYDPVMPGTDEKNFLGIQANFWSHIDRSEANIDKQLFPRILGLAETAWCSPDRKDWEQFSSAAIKNIDHLTRQHVNVYRDSTLVR
ncbi:MAG TPA: beta-N-acetylhexosaminidase [Bacteroidales bacterium]|nr:beta-N-acetylhexosaminidase [Bacteroidales bacterium]